MRPATGTATAVRPQLASARVVKAGIAVVAWAVKRACFASIRKTSDTLSAGQQPAWHLASDTFGTFGKRKLALHNSGTITYGLIVPIGVVGWRKAWWRRVCHLKTRDNNLRRLLSQRGIRKGGEGLPWPPFVAAI
jgi:hypothetical protein